TADFVICRSSPKFLFELAGGAQELVHTLVHVDRNSDGPGLVGNGAGDSLADPPRGVSRKFVAAAIFELVGRTHEADIAFLNQVQQVKSAIHVFLGDRNYQAEIGFDEVLLGALSFGFAMTNYSQAVAQLGE